MASHHDDDMGNPEVNQFIREMFAEKGEQMTERGLNLITAGKPGEEPLETYEIDGVMVRHMPSDPLAVRVSLGTPHDLTEGTYCVFRGDLSEAIELSERALAAMREIAKVQLT